MRIFMIFGVYLRFQSVNKLCLQEEKVYSLPVKEPIIRGYAFPLIDQSLFQRDKVSSLRNKFFLEALKIVIIRF